MNESTLLAPITALGDILGYLAVGFVARLLLSGLLAGDGIREIFCQCPEQESLLVHTEPVPAPAWVRREDHSDEAEGAEEPPIRLSDRIRQVLSRLLPILIITAYATHLIEAAWAESYGLIAMGGFSFLLGVGRGVLVWMDYFGMGVDFLS